jgi:glutathione reductase (NADPH)
MVVHGAGRVPEIDDLDLGAANVRSEKMRGIKVNEYLQSVSNPAVYAAGDAAASGLPLSPVASYEVVAANLIEGNHVKPNYEGIPSVVFPFLHWHRSVYRRMLQKEKVYILELIKPTQRHGIPLDV